MATPPTRVGATATVWNTTTTPKSATINSLVTGDLVLAMFIIADANTTFSSVTTTGGSTGSWTTDLNIGTGSASVRVVLAHATVSSNSNVTVQGATSGASTNLWGLNVIAYRNHGGIGANIGSKQTNSPSTSTMDCTFTTTNDNSAIEVICGDWSANTTSPTTSDEREAQAGNEVTTIQFAGDGTNYGVFSGVYADAGAAGSKTVGWSLGGTRIPSLGAFEILGTAGGGVTRTFTPIPFMR